MSEPAGKAVSQLRALRQAYGGRSPAFGAASANHARQLQQSLSHASRTRTQAKRIAEANVAPGGVGKFGSIRRVDSGDAWTEDPRADHACALFVPISANTQARKEGYFRLEWHLAEERAAYRKGRAVYCAGVRRRDGGTRRALPCRCLWLCSELPPAARPAAFAARVNKLLGAEGASADAVTDHAPPKAGPCRRRPAQIQNPSWCPF